MRRIVRIVPMGALLLTCSLVAGAQAPVQPGAAPPRDPTGQPQTGTAVIRGRVVALDTGAPLRFVQIRATVSDSPGHATMTDDEGRFELRDLPAGRYTLTAAKGGYVTLAFGQRHAFQLGRPIDLADGTIFDAAIVGLPRGSVIAGRVLDEYGDPVAGVRVRLSRSRFADGQQALSLVGGGTTDDRGEFRLFGLSPGAYLLSATIEAPSSSSARTQSGFASAPTWYPGTASSGAAESIVVGVGEERSGLTMQIAPARLSTLSGVILDPSSQPAAGVQVSLRQTMPDGGTAASRSNTRTGPDGSFSAAGVGPGEYEIRASGGGGASTGSIVVTVSGDDISGLIVPMSAGHPARGRFVGAGGGSLDGLRRGDVRVRPQAVPPASGVAGVMATADDWTFATRPIMSPVLIRAMTPPGWTLRRVLHQGQDVTDRPLDFSRGPVEDIVVELTQAITTLEGTVLDARGEAARDYVIVAFADNPDLWRPPSRFIHTAHPDQRGRFQIAPLPPGEYVAIALEYLEQGQETNPAILERLRPAGTRVSLREGETGTIELRLVDGV